MPVTLLPAPSPLPRIQNAIYTSVVVHICCAGCWVDRWTSLPLGMQVPQRSQGGHLIIKGSESSNLRTLCQGSTHCKIKRSWILRHYMGKLKIFRVSSQGSSSDIAYQRSNASKFWKSWFKKSLNNIVHLVLFLEPLWCTGVKLITYILVARRLAWCPNGLIRLVRYQTGRASQVCSQALDLKETFSILRQIEGDGYILSKGDITK